jgi:hypothetical protein
VTWAWRQRVRTPAAATPSPPSAEQRQWALNEKGIVEGAGLGSTAAMLAEAGSSGAQLTATVSAVEGTLRR